MVLWRSAASEEVGKSAAAAHPQHEAEAQLGDCSNQNTTTAVEEEDAPGKSQADANSRQKPQGKQPHSKAADADPPDTADTSTDTDTAQSQPASSSNRSGSTGKSRQRKPVTPAAASSSSSDDHHNNNNSEEGADHVDENDDSIPTIVWQPQEVQSTCEFTHIISGYSQKRESGCKKAEYSTVTQDSLGNRWRLIIYVNGNGRASNHHLSLFLQVADADDLPFGWKKAVSYVLTLEHPTQASLSYTRRNPDKTFKLCPKAIDWGWSQFITSDRIQQDHFVADDALIVRAQVTVKSSSVAIDEEDAELYLKCAVEDGDAKSVKVCLDQGASVNCQFKDDLYTPLHTACSSGTTAGSIEVLNLLLKEGADGNACNKWRESPLLIAANNGHRAAVEALLKHGADPSLCSEAGWSALTFAAHKVRCLSAGSSIGILIETRRLI